MTQPHALPRPERDVTLLEATVHYLPGGTEPLTEIAPDSLTAHRSRFGARPDCTGTGSRALLHAIHEAELTGRGGGHFPVAAKWRRVLESSRAGHRPVVVANGAEGEPLSRKDAALLELRPHLVLDGLACAAEAMHAREAVLWLHEDAHSVRAAVTRAMTERGGEAGPAVRVAFGPAHYLTGESSAVVSGLSGGAAVPSGARLPAAQHGVGGRPTLVQNVETLARVALLARGVTTGSTLLTVAGERHLVVTDVPDTMTVAAAVTRTIGGARPQAVLVGGYGGRWLPWSRAGELPVGPGALRAHGMSLGAGILAPQPEGACGLERTAAIAAFLAESSARQCGPCRFGLPAVAEVVRDLADTRARRRDSRRLDRYLAEVAGRGACHHPDGAVNLVRSALSTFADDVAAHIRGRCLHEGTRHG